MVSVEASSRAVAVVRYAIQSQQGFERWVLLSADHHWDNPDCDRDMLTRHLDLAAERSALVFVFGDLFCAMQGKYDKRSDKSKLRPEHAEGRYLDALVETAAEWYGPYAKNLAVISPGNHESSIYQRHETDLIARLVERINTQRGTHIIRGGYGGWVRFMFKRHAQQFSRNLYYFHGAGGGGAVTRGVIQSNRQAVYLPDADIVVNGHTHDEWVVPIQRHRINQTNTTYQDTQYHVRLPSYKDEFRDGYGGWHVETWKAPKPTGGVWLRWIWDGSRGVSCEFTPAK